MTIIMTEHRLEDVFPVADRVLIMDKGKRLLMEAPREAGRDLKKINAGHRMLFGLPSAVRIYHGLDAENAECPLTVRDGRNFLAENYGNCIRRLERCPAPEQTEAKRRLSGVRMRRPLPCG